MLTLFKKSGDLYRRNHQYSGSQTQTWWFQH